MPKHGWNSLLLMAGELATDIVTVTNHILMQQQATPNATGDLSIVINAVASACKWISNCVRKAELMNVIGLTGAKNVQEETVQKLDILSNEIMINLLKASGRAAVLVSEENEQAIIIDDCERGYYCLAFDPLDGSSNIDCGVSIGTIFGIWHQSDHSRKGQVSDILRSGKEMVAAGYCMYGSSSVFVLSMNKAVNAYTLDPNIGEFLLTHPNLKMGVKKIYSINEGNAHTFDKAVQTYIHDCKYPPSGVESADFKPYSARYVGSMVADVHRTLLYGGIFMYPGGKLRMLYECFPMSMIVEAAGGKASTGRQRMLDVIPPTIHSRSGIFLGSKDEVEKIEALYKQLDAGGL